jgi:3'-phosphoadenosine 5'-phosphosulfate sulfotransferase (PAPS reductase)/FAD synthetase
MVKSNHTVIQEKAEKAISWIYQLLQKGHPIACGYSAGKDSTAVLVLLLEAIKRAVNDEILIPRCYVTHSDTMIENPAMSFYASSMLDQLEMYCRNNKLPLEIVRVTPSLSASFAYTTIGRGKLPTFANSGNRACSVDWKLRPQQKALRRVLSLTASESTQPLICLHGSRYEESSSRSGRMSSRGEGNTQLVENPDSTYGNAPIADWSLIDVWSLLMACDSNRGRIYETFVDDFDWCLKLYRDANEGTCAIVFGDGGNKSACGNRFGCAWCPPASRNGDKSMEAMIASDSEYGYLKGVNRFSRLLVNTQYDLTKREWLGRTLSDAGYVRIAPDYYDRFFKRNLLRYLITLDVLEEERAEEHEAALVRGEIEDNEVNRRLCSAQFNFITPQILLAIDFAWAVHGNFERAFPALREWYEIRFLGRRYEIPDTEMFPRVSIPETRWFHVGTFDHPWGIDGLRDPVGEAINSRRRPDRASFMACKDYGGSNDLRRVITHDTDDELTIDPQEAGIFLNLEFEDLFFETQNMDSKTGLLFLLDRGLIKIGKGMIAKYDFFTRRSAYYRRLAEDMNVSDLASAISENTIPNVEHAALLKQVAHAEEIARLQQQPDFFIAV